MIQENGYDISVVLINTDDAEDTKENHLCSKYLKGDSYHIVMDYDRRLYTRFNATIPLAFITIDDKIVYRKRGFVNGR